MPKFTANAYLSHGAKIVRIGEQLELTKEQAERLGQKVSPFDAEEVLERKLNTGEPFTKEEFQALSADVQKEHVVDLGGDLNEYTNAEKRWEFVSDNQ